jgi:hypothetical protein
MDDVPLYVKENFRYRIALPFFSAASLYQLNPTGLRAETGHAHRIGSKLALKSGF